MHLAVLLLSRSLLSFELALAFFTLSTARLTNEASVLGHVGHHIRDVTPQQLETTLKVRFFRGSAKSCTIYDFFKLFTVVQSPYVMAMALVRCYICALFIRAFFKRPFSKRGHVGTAHFYGTLMKYVDSLLTPTLSILGTLLQCLPVSLHRHLCGISLRTFRIQLEQINQNGKMWQLNRFLRRNRSLKHHQQCLNLVSTNTRGLEIATASLTK